MFFPKVRYFLITFFRIGGKDINMLWVIINGFIDIQVVGFFKLDYLYNGKNLICDNYD